MTQTAVMNPATGASGRASVDPTRCDAHGKQVVTADVNSDKKADVTKFYEVREVNGQKTQVLSCKQVDLNHDGKVDIVYHYDQSGALSSEEFDLDFDGRFDLWTYYQGGKKVREEMDTNYDGRPDATKIFEAGRLVRVERDTNFDGRVDQWDYYEDDKLGRIGYDTTGSGRPDRWDRAPELDASSVAAAAEAGAGSARAVVPMSSTPASPGPVPGK